MRQKKCRWRLEGWWRADCRDDWSSLGHPGSFGKWAFSWLLLWAFTHTLGWVEVPHSVPDAQVSHLCLRFSAMSV